MPAADIGPIFVALADPSRRHLLETLARGSATLSELASGLPVTRQAVSKHLAALSGAGLVRARRQGRSTHFELTPEPLGEAVSWVEAVGAQWEERLRTLGERLTQDAPPHP